MLLNEVMLRRTKDMKCIDGNSIVPLPEKKIVIEYVELNEGERAFYAALMERSKHALSLCEVRKKYATAFTLLMRMRQICDHPFLVLGKEAIKSNSISHVKRDESIDDLHEVDTATATATATTATTTDHLGKGNDLTGEFIREIYSKLKKTIGESESSPRKKLKTSHHTDEEIDNSNHKETYLQNVMTKLNSLRSNMNGVDPDQLDTKENDSQYSDSDNRDSSNSPDECLICFEEKTVQDLAITPCGHILCQSCVQLHLSKTKKCSVCQRSFSSLSEIISLSRLVTTTKTTTTTTRSRSENSLNYESSTNEHLHQIPSSFSFSAFASASTNWRRWGDRIRKKSKDTIENDE